MENNECESYLLRALAVSKFEYLVALTRLILEEYPIDLVSLLINALKDNNHVVRENAAKLLKQIGDIRAVEPLINALNDKNAAAAEALGEIGDIRAVEPLINALKSCEDQHFQSYVASALGQIGDIRAVEPLINALNDNRSRTSLVSIIYALGEIGDIRAVESLTNALKHKNLLISRCATIAIKQITSKNILNESSPTN